MAACQVDFYILQTPSLDGHRLACRLALMAWERGHAAQVLAADKEQAQAFDELLWRSPAERFVPHARAGAPEAAAAPVTITTAEGLERGSVLINISRAPVTEPQRFERLLEIVPHQPEDREASRDKFRYYRSQGLDPKTHDISG